MTSTPAVPAGSSASKTFAIAVAAFVLVFLCWAYSAWRGGYVIHSGEYIEHAGYAFKIREIPLNNIPGMSIGYAYRCEVWRRRHLYQATTIVEDSMVVKRPSITPGFNEVVFHLNEHRIICAGWGSPGQAAWRWETD